MKWTTRIAYRVLPSHAWGEIYREWSLTKRRWRNSTAAARRLLAGKRKLKLHFGCGKRVTAGWINVDAFDQPGFDLRWDLRDPLPCENGVAEFVYSEHVLEHLEHADAENALSEMYRMLEPGGRLRLGVPDAEIYMKHYIEGHRDFFEKLKRLGGATTDLQTPIIVINQMFRMGGHHRFAWDFETLANAVAKAGFGEIRRCSSGESSRPDLCLDDPEHAFETLYVEATKLP